MIRDALIGATLLALVMTLGDVIWAVLDLPHRRAYGVVHGALMCLCFGMVVGWRTNRMQPAAIGGLIIGVVAAGVFYALAWHLRYVALLPGWMTFWILFAFLQQWLSPEESPAVTAVRGLVAALLSGAAFVAISGIWTRPPANPNYLVNAASWFIAYLPGFISLFFWRPRSRSAARYS